MSTVSRTLLRCDICGHQGYALWNSANRPAELLKVSKGFVHIGAGLHGEDYYACFECKCAAGMVLLPSGVTYCGSGR